MADVFSPEERSQVMAAIKGKDTKPEIAIRSGLHRLGFRFRKNKKTLPGKPDIVFQKYKAVIFVHGCFWHGHDCHLFKWPRSRPEFWQKKITRNREVDQGNIEKLSAAGWRIGIVWECAIKGKTRRVFTDVVEACAGWLTSDAKTFEIRGAI